ncbi:hypothetical protein HUJ04_013456 [Dendroctonus ponderosae]|nr:hypothetical protein HUJ04_013456 [Dendroctonus ponderosae]
MHPKALYFQADALTIRVCAKYSYNKPVAGLAFVKISSSMEGFEDVHKLSEMVGCAHFTINQTELGLEKLQDSQWQTYLLLTATVTEFGTNQMDVTSGRVELSLKVAAPDLNLNIPQITSRFFQGFQLRFSSSPLFIPGVPYEGQLQLTKLLINLQAELVEICCHLAIKKSWNLFNDKQCQNYTVSGDGTVAFRLWPLKEQVLHVHLHARSVNRSAISTDLKLVRMFSPSASHIQLKKEADAPTPCNHSYGYVVTFGALGLDKGDSLEFFYKVKTGVEILQMGKHVHVVGKPSLQDSADASLFLGQMHKYNLHQLLTIPTGCGEQIMASMAPNLYVLRYLNATGSLTAGLKQKILRNLKLGYQRILNYAHTDGSFSAFGYFDPSGSMFLTTFVVRVLQEAKSLIYVDAAVLDRAVRWIFQHQLENGCFDTMHHVFQDMGGTNMENSTAGLTAYVILSLFDAKVDVPDAVQVNAKYCIRSQNDPDRYSMVISSYALFKVQWISEASRFLEKAIEVARKENEFMWWSTRESDDSSASDIEVSSYALLACLEQKSATHMAYAHSIVQWLISKMGPLGGFKSTQASTSMEQSKALRQALDAIEKERFSCLSAYHRRS